ncbi:MAG: hypothetical protein AB8H86_27835 [Polyangiales bacterium]
MMLRMLVVMAFLVGACGDDDDRLSAVGDGGDADRPPGADSGTDTGREAPEDQGLFATPGAMTNPDPDDNGARCVEAEEDARGAPLGCEDTGCRQRSHACCVGRAECCTGSAEVLDYPFETCTSDCVEGLLFGSPLPTLVNGFSPGGDAEFDSGVVLDQRLDLRGERVTLEADFVVPSTSCVGVNCFQTVGVSVARNSPDGANAHVRTIAGLLWSGGSMYLIVGERSIASWTAESGGVWSLTLNADGDVNVQNAGSGVNETFDVAILASEAYVVLYGHNVNPGGGEESAQLRSLNISRSQCEMTRQWSQRSAVEVGSGVTQQLMGATSPTTLRGLAHLDIAYLREGRLVTTFRGSDDTPSLWVDGDDTTNALIDATGPIAGPELANENGQTVLYYEVEGQIFRAEAVEDERLRFSGGARVADIAVSGATLHGPTIVSRGEALESVIVVRAEYPEQRSSLVAFSLSVDGSVASAQLRDLLPTGALGEELGDPELFIRNRLYQLYVPYRRGTRWRLAHMTSADLVFWTIADEVALESDGPEELFGPRAPSVGVSEAGVELFYERFDGSEQSLGRVFRRTPAIADLQSGI